MKRNQSIVVARNSTENPQNFQKSEEDFLIDDVKHKNDKTDDHQNKKVTGNFLFSDQREQEQCQRANQLVSNLNQIKKNAYKGLVSKVDFSKKYPQSTKNLNQRGFKIPESQNSNGIERKLSFKKKITGNKVKYNPSTNDYGQ